MPLYNRSGAIDYCQAAGSACTGVYNLKVIDVNRVTRGCVERHVSTSWCPAVFYNAWLADGTLECHLSESICDTWSLSGNYTRVHNRVQLASSQRVGCAEISATPPRHCPMPLLAIYNLDGTIRCVTEVISDCWNYSLQPVISDSRLIGCSDIYLFCPSGTTMRAMECYHSSAPPA